MCQQCATGSAETIMAVHSGDKSDLMNAAGGLVPLAISQEATEMREGNVYMYVSWKSFFKLLEPGQPFFPHDDVDKITMQPISSQFGVRSRQLLIWISAAACTVLWEPLVSFVKEIPICIAVPRQQLFIVAKDTCTDLGARVIWAHPTPHENLHRKWEWRYCHYVFEPLCW